MTTGEVLHKIKHAGGASRAHSVIVVSRRKCERTGQFHLVVLRALTMANLEDERIDGTRGLLPPFGGQAPCKPPPSMCRME